MQASVHTFDQVTGDGSVVADDGRVWTFDGPVFAASGLRLLRVGQRLTVTPDDGDPDARRLARIGIRGIADGMPLS